MSHHGVATTGFIILTLVYSGIAEAAPLLILVGLGGSVAFILWCLVATVGVAGFTGFLYFREARDAAQEEKWGLLRDIILIPVVAFVIALLVYIPARTWWVGFTSHAGALAMGICTVLILGGPPFSAWCLRQAPNEGAEGTMVRALVVFPILTLSIITWFALTLNSLHPINL